MYAIMYAIYTYVQTLCTRVIVNTSSCKHIRTQMFYLQEMLKLGVRELKMIRIFLNLFHEI